MVAASVEVDEQAPIPVRSSTLDAVPRCAEPWNRRSQRSPHVTAHHRSEPNDPRGRHAAPRWNSYTRSNVETIRMFCRARRHSDDRRRRLYLGTHRPRRGAPIPPKTVDTWAWCGVNPDSPVAATAVRAMAQAVGIDATFGPCNIPQSGYTPVDPKTVTSRRTSTCDWCN